MKIIIISIIAFVIFIMVIKLSGNIDRDSYVKNPPATTNSDNEPTQKKNNVSEVEGKQIIELIVNDGYSPRKSTAKAGIPTIIRFITENTFDCSSAVSIRSLNISKNLPSTGSTDIEIGSHQKGVLKGSCGMGMYPFEIEFE